MAEENTIKPARRFSLLTFLLACLLAGIAVPLWKVRADNGRKAPHRAMLLKQFDDVQDEVDAAAVFPAQKKVLLKELAPIRITDESLAHVPHAADRRAPDVALADVSAAGRQVPDPL